MFDKPTIDESINIKGEWWIPGKSKKKVQGTLNLSSNNGALLDLNGALPGEEGKRGIFGAPLISPKIINGNTVRGEKVTLVNCHETFYSMGNSSKIRAYMTVTDVHFKKYESLVFNELYLDFTNLPEWIQLSKIDVKWDHEKDITTISSTPRVNEIFSDVGNYDIEIISYCTLPDLIALENEASIKTDGSIKLSSKNGAHIDDFDKVIQKLRMLLCVATQRPVYLNSISAHSNKQINKSKTGQVYSIPMEIYKRQLDRIPIKQMDFPDNMLFSYNKVKNHFGNVLMSLVNNYDNLEPLLVSHTSWFYVKIPYMQPKFLSLVMGLESFYRKTRKRSQLPKHEHRERIKEILSSMDSKYRSWVKSALIHSNELSLREKLRNILADYHNVVVGYPVDNEKFIKKVVDTRNFLVHGDSKLKTKTATPNEMYHLIRILEIVIEACILCELGIPQDEARELFTNAKIYNRKYHFEQWCK